MYALIDVTNSAVIARHDSGKALQALAFIQFANVDCVVLTLATNRTFSLLNIKQLTAIAVGMGVEVSGDYNSVLNTVRQAIEAADWLLFPYSLGQIEAQAYAIHSSDDAPYTFDPEGSTAKPGKRWHFDPQRNRKRIDSTFGTTFRAGLGYGEGIVPPHMVAQLTGRTRIPSEAQPEAPSRPRSAPAVPKVPKEPRAPSGPATRPKGGTTARVWEICDTHEVARNGGDIKAMRSSIIAACEAEGINKSTASVQYGKWKSSNGL